MLHNETIKFKINSDGNVFDFLRKEKHKKIMNDQYKDPGNIPNILSDILWTYDTNSHFYRFGAYEAIYINRNAQSLRN